MKCAANKLLENLIIIGSNKRTFCNSILKQLYGPHINIFSLNTSQYNDIGLKTLRMHIISFIDSDSFLSNPVGFKCVIFEDTNKLSVETQYALRRIIEVYTNIRFIFLIDDINNIHSSLLSRLLVVRLHPTCAASIGGEVELFYWLDHNKSTSPPIEAAHVG